MKRISKTRHKPLTEIGRLRTGLSLAWLFVWLLLLVAGSCTQTDVEAGFNLNVLATRTPVTRSITFTPDGTIESDTLAVGIKDSVQTKATASLTEAQESQIASLWVGQYDVATGTRLFNQYLSSLTGTTVNLKLKQSQNGSRSRVYFVSNAGDLGAIGDTTTLKKQTLAYTSTAAGLPDNNLCKMMGRWEGVVEAGGVKDITVELTRLLAKITFTYSMGADFAFTPTSVVLKNAPTLSQVAAPTGQLTTGNSYNTYTDTGSNSGGTVYWYLPENMAGTVSGDNAVDAEKKKIGTGVTNATYIELTGNAVQGGVTYQNVTFRFYPGSNKNNYDIIRNSHYTMAVTLVGIDVSDERITVGEIPPIVVDPTEMPAKKGGTKEIQITARPGQAWTFDMPLWLSALLNGTNMSSGATITHQGPATVVFKAEQANPRADKREVSFNIDVNGVDQEITITQTGSTLTPGAKVSLAATADSEGSPSFTATEGLQWSAALSDSWLGWSDTNPGASGIEAPAGAQTLKVKATTSNPSAQVRSGTITVKAGASVGDANYTNLKQEIAVEQAGSTVTGSTANNIAAKGATGDASFTATKGLAWASSVTSGSWITLNSGGSGTPTTGAAQTINYTAAVNPSSSARSGTITVRGGDATAGPTGNIILNQLGSTLSVSGASTVAATASAGNTSTFTATPGLSWNVGVASTGSWLSLTSTISGTNNTTVAAQTITYSAVVNPNESTRNGTITVKAGNAVTGTDAGLTKTITVTQSASTLTASGTTPLGAVKESSGTLRFTGTKGLGITITPPSWITLTATAPATTTGSEQTVGYKANATNPDATERAAANITVKAGNITKTVAVKQSASSLTASISPTTALAATKDATGTFTMNGTKDLAYSFTAGFPAWLTVTNGTASTSGGTTTGGNQTLTYKTASVNPNGSERSQTVTVKAGNILKSVTVKQSASSFSRTNPTSNIAAAANSTTTGSIAATAGLAWTISPGTHNGITVSPTSGIGNATLTFKGAANTGAARTGTFTISVTGASPARTATITATQTAGETGAYVGNLQVCKTDEAPSIWSTANTNCSNSTKEGKTDWRLPTKDELVTMYNNKSSLQAVSGFTAFVSDYYWSSTAGSSGMHWYVSFYSGNITYSGDAGGSFVRCVRGKN